MIGAFRIEGHAIVSDDDRIADAAGHVPQALRNEADWARFQAALDNAAVTVLGRRGHEAHPNPKRRNRLVLSSAARGVERRADAWWWNPAETPAGEALERAAPGGGIAAIPGGRRVFDLFLDLGFDAFHLVRAGGVAIPGGIALFSGAKSGERAEAILAGRGMVPGESEVLDPVARVSLTIFRMP